MLSFDLNISPIDKIGFIAFLYLSLLVTTTSAQNTFKIESKYISRTLDFNKYKALIITDKFEIDFYGNKLTGKPRFTPDSNEGEKTNKAIQTRYAETVIRQVENQYKNKTPGEGNIWNNNQKTKFIRMVSDDQKHKIQKFDRYFFGYINSDNEKLILIRFDPHSIKHYTISGETFVDVLTILIYNVDRNILSYAGWAEFKE
ncbi:MAG: hypothetical protein ABI091_19370 [Ferruginibacter sp.]